MLHILPGNKNKIKCQDEGWKFVPRNEIHHNRVTDTQKTSINDEEGTSNINVMFRREGSTPCSVCENNKHSTAEKN